MEINKLYPLKFNPILKDKIWGGSKLGNLLNKKGASDKAGESWEISGVEGDVSVVSEGFLQGNSLEELSEIYMGDLVGDSVYEKFGTQFPLLIKYIDANDDLSIQVHPNDEQAAERHNSFGKTEMWYVMQADENAKLIAGFNQEVTKEQYLEKLKSNEILDILNSEVVAEGDVYFMPAGRIHAIGSGCLIAEIQQTSDVTYRVYDFDRRDDKGNTRELHTEQAVDVIDYNYYKSYKTKYIQTINQPNKIVECDYFTTNLVEFNGSIERDMNTIDSFVIYMCVSGNAKLIVDSESETVIQKGETILVPAEISQYYLEATEDTKLLEVFISQKNDEDK